MCVKCRFLLNFMPGLRARCFCVAPTSLWAEVTVIRLCNACRRTFPRRRRICNYLSAAVASTPHVTSTAWFDGPPRTFCPQLLLYPAGADYYLDASIACIMNTAHSEKVSTPQLQVTTRRFHWHNYTEHFPLRRQRNADTKLTDRFLLFIYLFI